MYIPPNCESLEKATQAQIRLGLQGYAGNSKTWASLTFPNPIVMNYDRGLGSHIGRPDIIEVPFWNKDYTKKFGPTIKDATEKWLTDEAPKLLPEQTLIIDGGTAIQYAFHKYVELNPPLTKGGKEDGYAEWKLKLVFFGYIMDQIKRLKCNVIYICHEAEKKEKSGDYLGKIRPLLSGSFGDELVSHFTDWFRCLSASKPNDVSQVKSEALPKWGMTSAKEFMEMCDTFKDTSSIYFWQTASDDVADCKVSSLVGCPRFIPANWTSFQKYMRKPIVNV